MIPTVRVANPADPTQFMTINAADYREVLHGPLWPEQLVDTPAPQPPRSQTRDPAVRDYAAALMLDALDLKRTAAGLPPIGTLSPDQQLLALRDARNEYEDAARNYARSQQVSDAEKARLDTEASAGATTPEQAPEQAPEPKKAATEPTPSTEPAQQPEPAPPVAPANPWGGAAPEPQLTVEKGPGSKWYVMLGKEPKTEGFATKGEAEMAKKALLAPKE